MSEWVSQWQGHLLSCSGQLKIDQCVYSVKSIEENLEKFLGGWQKLWDTSPRRACGRVWAHLRATSLIHLAVDDDNNTHFGASANSLSRCRTLYSRSPRWRWSLVSMSIRPTCAIGINIQHAGYIQILTKFVVETPCVRWHSLYLANTDISVKRDWPYPCLLLARITFQQL